VDLMANEKRKKIIDMFRRLPPGSGLVASQLCGLLHIERDEAVERLKALVSEGVLECHTNEVVMYIPTREWRDKLK